MRSSRMAAGVILAHRWEAAALQRQGNDDPLPRRRGTERHVDGIPIDPERQQILHALGAAHGKTDPVPLIDPQANETVCSGFQSGDQRRHGHCYRLLHLSISAARSNQPISVGGR